MGRTRPSKKSKRFFSFHVCSTRAGGEGNERFARKTERSAVSSTGKFRRFCRDNFYLSRIYGISRTNRDHKGEKGEEGEADGESRVESSKSKRIRRTQREIARRLSLPTLDWTVAVRSRFYTRRQSVQSHLTGDECEAGFWRLPVKAVSRSRVTKPPALWNNRREPFLLSTFPDAVSDSPSPLSRNPENQFSALRIRARCAS